MYSPILRYFLTFILMVAGARGAAAQGPTALSHVAVYVTSLAQSDAFYKNVLLLQEIPEPFKDGRHTWFRIGPHSQLHIIQGGKPEEHDINTHLAFSVPDLKQFMAHLDQLNVRYGNWKGDEKQTTPRPDGVKQIYFQDPDKFWVEVNDDKF
ncbi:VOC family protein [Hymenobacter caeli]|uniref:Lactoylglutathione lyase n=1 Tax=Hymenobacter caeli TaxID=2735894 RepID=A0ABX2FRA3_9BACT|nr:VOC family protein [Hymenobacter caeli]NRT19708.1 lactoylglutathione lyase [Hymenobacter caeli]